MRRSGKARDALGKPAQTRRPPANGAQHDRLGAVLALVVGELARMDNAEMGRGDRARGARRFQPTSEQSA